MKPNVPTEKLDKKVPAVDHLAGRTLRELLTLARERLGPAASGLKTREELVIALAGQSPEEVSPASAVPLVTADFFRLRNG